MRRRRVAVNIESDSNMNEARAASDSFLTRARNRMIFISSAAGATTGAAREENR